MNRSTVGLIALLVLLGVAPAMGSIQNGSFEAGTYDPIPGWTTDIPTGGFAKVVKDFEFDPPIGLPGVPPDPTYFDPTDGDWFALLKADGHDSKTKLFQTFTANAGDELSFDVFFATKDYGPYNDWGKAYVEDSSGAKVTGGDLFYADRGDVGNYGHTGWTPVSVVLPAADYYTVYFEVANFGDPQRDSYVGVDNVLIPEPASLIVWSLLGAFGVAVGRRQSRRRKRHIHISKFPMSK